MNGSEARVEVAGQAMRYRLCGLLVVFAALGAACGGADDSGKKDRAGARRGERDVAPVESTTRAGAPATTPRAPAPDRTGAPRVLFLGTSLTAGYGLDNPEEDAYPAVIQRMADSAGVRALVINAGLSGETSAGALRRADWLLKEHADLVVIETGANDGLRGLDPDSTAANLRALIAKVRAANAATKIVLVQMEAPTNLGARYTQRFHAVFGQVADSERVTLLPFLLNGVAGIVKLNQGDGIHPTREGARLAAKNVWPGIAQALRR
jgi:acyl-CoA thioesterase-1